MRFTIGLKITVGFATVMLLLVVVAFIGLNGFNTLMTTYEEQVRRIDSTLVHAHVIESSVATELGAVAGHLVTSEVRHRDEFENAKATVDRSLEALRGIVWDEGARTRIESLASAIEKHAALARPIFDRTDYSAQEAAAFVSVTLREARGQLIEAVQAVVDYQTMRVEFVTSEAAAAAARTRLIIILIAASALVVGGTVSVLIQRGITGPVRETMAAALRLADGDLTVEELRVGSRDEIADMADAFNRMAGSLRQVVEQMRNTSNLLMDNCQRLIAVADESTSATGQIAAAVAEVAQGTNNQVTQVHETRSAMDQLRLAVDQIAQGAQEQAHRAEETTRSLTRMTGSVEQVSGSAQQVAAAANRGADRARAGGEAVGRVTAGMEQIDTSVNRVAERVNELGEYSRQIGQIVEMISDIAEQTNLLALNAAIEAARAGEHGRGFGVVAEEVRMLAERSAQSTREIGNLIANIQTAVDAAVTEMEAGTTHVAAGTELAGHARTALAEIVEAISTTDRLAQEISGAAAQMAAASPEMLNAMTEMAAVTEQNTAATEQMAASSDQVVRSMDEVAAISEQTAAATEEVSGSTEEVNASAEELKSSVLVLTDVASDLGKLVGRFRL